MQVWRRPNAESRREKEMKRLGGFTSPPNRANVSCERKRERIQGRRERQKNLQYETLDPINTHLVI